MKRWKKAPWTKLLVVAPKEKRRNRKIQDDLPVVGVLPCHQSLWCLEGVLTTKLDSQKCWGCQEAHTTHNLLILILQIFTSAFEFFEGLKTTNFVWTFQSILKIENIFRFLLDFIRKKIGYFLFIDRTVWTDYKGFISIISNLHKRAFLTSAPHSLNYHSNGFENNMSCSYCTNFTKSCPSPFLLRRTASQRHIRQIYMQKRYSKTETESIFGTFLSYIHFHFILFFILFIFLLS